ncbi:MAG TPA: YbaK/EbsC family protein [Candidatus Aphodousia faecipullorum]|nr:YbaK/EbsC family protein [Candidatus Aphodousia faecipullorum]
MSIESVKKFLNSVGLEDRYIELEGSTATVELAAQQLKCEPARIAKSMAMLLKSGEAIVIVTNGTAKIANNKYKAFFKEKAHFCPAERLQELVGHPMGGVSPFGLKPGVKLFLDISLKLFDVIYPAGGATYNAVKVTPEELQKVTQAQWIDITKDD